MESLRGLLLVVCAATCIAEEQLPWWRTAILYQIYPRSFKDSNGDGVGDLKGITQNADYLKEIGVDAAWISPIFKSPMVDFGYDVSDFRDIEPTFGSLEDFRELVQKMKSLGIKIMLDLVPNHSSDKHVWFQKSLQRIDPYTDYYVWVDGNKSAPPNNWLSLFGGSAWEWREEREQYYLHFFTKEQPELNYWNEAVVREFVDIIKYWMDMGVDGFRVDAVHLLVEDHQLRDEPPIEGITNPKTWIDYNHIYTLNQPQTYKVLQHWADFVYNYSLVDGNPKNFLLELYTSLNATLKYYGHGNTSFMQPFNFDLLMKGSQKVRAPELYDIIHYWLTNLTDGENTNWVAGNHDNIRVAERYGEETIDALNILTGVLPGVKVTYYGEEIGMRDTFIRWDQTVDPIGISGGPLNYQVHSRDPFRTPLQWNSDINAGFSTNKTWLPVNPNYWWLNVEAQRTAETSHLKIFQEIANARKDPVLQRGNLTLLVPDNDTFVAVRSYNDSSFVFIFNMGSKTVDFSTKSFFSVYSLDVDMSVVVASINTGINKGTILQKGSALVSLRPRAAVLLRSLPSGALSSGNFLSSNLSLTMVGLLLVMSTVTVQPIL